MYRSPQSQSQQHSDNKQQQPPGPPPPAPPHMPPPPPGTSRSIYYSSSNCRTMSVQCTSCCMCRHGGYGWSLAPPVRTAALGAPRLSGPASSAAAPRTLAVLRESRPRRTREEIDQNTKCNVYNLKSNTFFFCNRVILFT